jgi:hypothetical protein
VLIGAVARFTRLAWNDDILAPHLRNWAYRHEPADRSRFDVFFGKLIECPWCVAPWIATPLTAITFALSYAPDWAQHTWTGLLAVPAVSMAASWLAERSA